jgi:rod shape-determining protein MreC
VRPQRSDQARPFLTLGIVALVWLLLPAVVKRFARASFFELQAPVEVTAAGVRQLQDFWALRTRSADDLIAAGKKTAEALANYELSARQQEQLAAENERLRGLLNLPADPGWHYEQAQVVRRDFSAWWQQLIIRKGADYHIPVGAPVVYAGGVAGRVREVGAHTSMVELISSPGLRLAAVVDGDTRPVSYQGGENPAFGTAHGTAEYIPLDILATPAAPRRLVTSGLGGVFPAGLPIGELTRAEPGPDGLFKTGEVRLDPALAALHEVTVLVPLHPEDTDPPSHAP